MSLFNNAKDMKDKATAKNNWLVARTNRMHKEELYAKSLNKKDLIFEIECARHTELLAHKDLQHKSHKNSNSSIFICTIVILIIEATEFYLELSNGIFGFSIWD